MGAYSVPIVIGVDEEKIAKAVENDVERQVIDNLTQMITKSIFRKRNYYNDKYDDPSMIIEMTKEKVNQILAEHEEEIIQGAIDKLADKLARTKVVKEAAAEAVKQSA